MFEINTFLEYLSQYGMIVMFIIVFLEYLNLPGFPAGVIMPLAGVWVANSGANFVLALLLSVLAGLIGSWILYLVGWYGGDLILKKYTDKFPKHKDYIDKKMDYLKEKSYVGVFISKLIPMARTIIGVPAGVLKLDFIKYTVYSALGILVWNGAFIGAGYVFGDAILKYLA